MSDWPWIDELPRDNSDVSSENETQSSSCSLSSSSKSNHDEIEKEYMNSAANQLHVSV